MTPLQWGIRNVLRANRDGARTTQYQRQAILFQFAGDVQQLGHHNKRLAKIGNRYVERVVELWKRQGISDATIKNRLSAIRWLGQKINKPNLGYENNAQFGLKGRTEGQTNKAQRLTVAVPQQVTDPYIRTSLKLQAAFGLRRSEAMKLQPKWADRGTELVLKGSWTKGGGRERFRSAPLINAVCWKKPNGWSTADR